MMLRYSHSQSQSEVSSRQKHEGIQKCFITALVLEKKAMGCEKGTLFMCVYDYVCEHVCV